MIELRWKIDPLVKVGDDENSVYGVKRTLQFRLDKRFLHRALDGWTEWLDVPEVPSGKLATSLTAAQSEVATKDSSGN